MGNVVSIDLYCPKCKQHVGENYTTRPNNQHTSAFCADCEAWVKHLSKEDKYNTKEQQRQVWQKTRGRCCYCSKVLEPFEKNGYCVEHIDPQILGGGHETVNLYPCCKSCNSQKGGKTLERYREYMISKRALPQHIFYFEVLEFSTLGEYLKVIF